MTNESGSPCSTLVIGHYDIGHSPGRCGYGIGQLIPIPIRIGLFAAAPLFQCGEARIALFLIGPE